MIYFIGNPTLIKEDLYIDSTVEDCLEYFKDKTILQIDIETTGGSGDKLPNPYEQQILSLQIGDYERQYVIDTTVIPPIKFKALLEDITKVKILCNAFFDLRFLLHQDIKVKNVYDIFLAEMCLTLGQDHPKGYRSLDGMTQRYLNVKLNKDVRGQIHYRGLDATVIKYAAEDVKYMEKIKDLQQLEINKQNLQKCVDLENKFVVVLAKISYRGFKLDPNAWKAKLEKNKEELLKYRALLDNYVVEKDHKKFLDCQLDLFSSGLKCNITWSSPSQVEKYFAFLGINTLIRDKSSGMLRKSVDGSHLIKQKDDFDILPIYLRYKEIEKEISTYGEKFLEEHLNPFTLRIHSEFFQILATGRISSNNPNLQNIPATDEKGNLNELRKAFVAEKGYTLLICDYSSQEPRITADKSKDPALMDFIYNGDGDLHSLVATAISEYLMGEPVKVSKKNDPFCKQVGMKLRTIGKIINLGLDYGKSAFTLKDDLKCTVEEAQALINILKDKFPEKEKYFKTQMNFAMKNGFVIIDKVTKRRSHFTKYPELSILSKIPYNDRSKLENSRFFRLKGELERFAKNYPIQGTAGSMTKTAAIIAEEEFEKENLDAHIVNLVHDEIVFEVNKKDIDRVSKIAVDAMIRAGKIFSQIPMKVDPIESPYWKKD